jgi:hypothetical protein
MKITKTMSRKQFAAAVVKQLKQDEILAVLVGGACVSIYTNNRHESKDFDFISPDSVAAISASLAKIGFERQNRYFVHPDSEFYVEFPTGPIAIGHQEPVKAEGKLRVGDTIIKMLSPTQSVMDRLSSFFHFGDRRSLIHALWICEQQPVSLAKLKVWAEKEQMPEKFGQFLDAWKKLKKTRRRIGHSVSARRRSIKARHRAR